jgi:hypothetical protein
MKKVLILSPDALFRAKLQHRFAEEGVPVISITRPEPVSSYLDSGEIGVLVADMAADDEMKRTWLPDWLASPGVTFILTGDDVAAELDRSFDKRGADIRIIGKENLVSLARDLLPELHSRLGLPGRRENLPMRIGERRAAGRSIKSLRVYLDPAGDAAGSAVKSRTINISPRGTTLMTPVPLAPEARVSLKICLPAIPETLFTRARVVWSRPEGPDGGFVAGLFFDRIDGNDRFHLVRYLARESA